MCNCTSVCAVTVTYGDRANLCIETVRRALAAKADRVIVVDNGSNFASAKELQVMSDTFENVSLVRLPHNRGSAGGFATGIEMATGSDCTHVWLLDDDNWVEPDSLNALREFRNKCAVEDQDPDVLVACYRTANPRHVQLAQGGDPIRVYPVPGSFLTFDLMQYLARSRPAPSTPGSEIPYAPYGGLLVSMLAVRKVGFPDVSLTLYEDDTLWTARMVAAGHRIHFCSIARIEDADQKWTRTTGGMGAMQWLDGNQPVRLYYGVRNRVFFDKTRVTTVRARMRYQVNKFTFLATALAFSILHRYHGWRLFVRAIRDGQRSKLDSGLPLQLLLRH